MRRWPLALILTLLFAGCGNGCSGSADESGASSGSAQRTEASGGESAETPTPPAEREPPPDPGPPPELRVSAEVDAYDGHATPRIANLGDATELSGTLALERREGESWTAVEDVRLLLRYACDEAPAECVTLAPGAVFIPPPWLGRSGEAQCECEECGPADEGTYRFVVRSCDGAHTVAGEPFELVRR